MTMRGEAERRFAAWRARGDARELARVFDLTAQELLLVAAHLSGGGDGPPPEDLLQATFLEAMQSAERWDDDQPLLPWLIGILTNVTRSERRRQRRRPDPDRLPAPTPVGDPAASLAATEIVERFHHALGELPAEQRHVLTLRLVHGLTPTEIAHSLGRSPGTIKSWLHRGTQRLRELLPASIATAIAVLLGPSDAIAQVRNRVLEAADPVAPTPRAAEPAAERAVTAAAAGPNALAIGAIAALVALTALGLTLGLGRSGADPEASTAAATGSGADSDGTGGDPDAASRRPVDAGDRGAVVREEILTVVWPDGRPAPGVRVRLEPRAGSDVALHATWCTTDATGTITKADLPPYAPGPWTARLDRAGDHAIELGGAIRPTLRIPAGVELVVEVADADDRPVADADVWLSSADRLDDGVVVGRTDATGQVTLRDVQPGRALCARRAGFRSSALAPVRSPIGDADAVAVRVALGEPAPRLVGRVTATATGDPVPGARILVGHTFGPLVSLDLCANVGLRPPTRPEPTEDGTFEVATLAPHRTVPIWVRAPGFALWRTTVTLGDAGSRTPIVARLEPGGRLAGRVDGPDGRPVDSAQIAARPPRPLPSFGWRGTGPRWQAPTARSSGDGTFVLRGIEPGRSAFDAVHDAGRASAWRDVEADGRTPDWQARLGDGYTLRGTLTTAVGGAPLPDWRIAVRTSDGRPTPDVVTTDAFGAFTVAGLDVGIVAVHAFDPDAAWQQPTAVVGDVEVGAREETTIALTVAAARRATAHLTGVVLDADGDAWRQPLTITDDRIELTVTPDDQGRFACAVPRGTFRIAALTGMSYAVLHGPIEVGVGAAVDCGTLRASPGGCIQVHVTTPDAARLDQVLVSAQPIGSGFAATVATLSADGRARTFPVPPGRYRVQVADARFAATSTVVDVVSGRDTRAELTCLPGCPVTVTVEHAWIGPGARLTVRCAEVTDGRVEERVVVGYDLSAPPASRRPLRLRLPPGEYELSAARLADGRIVRERVVVAGPAPRPGPDVTLDLRR